MAQNPLPPPPSSGGVLDGWLYLLWRRLTQTGQILWDSITPGTSADVAAAVTDETGSPGSLVFSGNPTLTGVTVTRNAETPLSPASNTVIHAVGLDAVNNTFQMDSYGGANAIRPVRANGTLSSPSALLATNQIFATNCIGYDGTSYSNQANWIITASENWDGSAKGTAFTLNLTPVESTTVAQVMSVQGSGTTTLGGLSTAPAIKVIPVSSQARWIEVTGATSSTNPTIGVSGGNLATSAVFMPVQATTAGAPAYVLGGMYYDTTLNKLRIGGATAWETVTSV